jgi:hypothetical protein
MSLNAIAFLGSTPVGAPLLGYLSDVTNPRLALSLGGAATMLASIPLFALAARQRAQRALLHADGAVVTPTAAGRHAASSKGSDETSNVVALPVAQAEEPQAEEPQVEEQIRHRRTS